MLPELPTEADVIKTAAGALLAATLVVPSLAGRDPASARAWFGSGGGRLLVAACGVAALGTALAADAVWSSALTDRVLLVVLAHVAAMAGARAARRHPLALVSAIGLATGAAAVVALLQGLGLENAFSPPPERSPSGAREIVALMGNTNRAGALLALGVCAIAAAMVAGRARAARAETAPGAAAPAPARAGPRTRPRDAPRDAAHGAAQAAGRAAAGEVDGRRAPSSPTGWLAAVLLLLLTAGLVLTQARGARVAAAAGLAATATAVLVARRGGAPRGRRWTVPGGALLGGVLLAAVVGGPDVIAARKLPESASILSGHDVTTNVRLALWRATARMVADRPLVGHGLGRFRAAFPPYRERSEAARPGLAGVPTVAWHPHNELLLGFAEGGLIGGALWVLLLVLSLRRAWRGWRTERGAADLAALAVLVAGAVAGMGQDAWSSPGTALPFWAAVGFVWAPRHATAPASRGVALALALGVALAVVPLGWPRLVGHVGAWRFQRRAAVEGIDLDNFALLVDAAAAAPRDEDLQRMLQLVGMRISRAEPRVRAQVSPHIADAVLRLEALGVTR